MVCFGPKAVTIRMSSVVPCLDEAVNRGSISCFHRMLFFLHSIVFQHNAAFDMHPSDKSHFPDESANAYPICSVFSFLDDRSFSSERIR
ncbi:MAG: hypothetical protein CM1200mP24_07290 [Gammaproteobacteria bacterium]|nr:MAG: hypothetical protein CM1200mP24_07290 [Gammaproteobacteria bacterium]